MVPLLALMAMLVALSLWLRATVRRIDAPPDPEFSIVAKLESVSLVGNQMRVKWRVHNRSQVAVCYGSFYDYADLYLRQPATQTTPEKWFWIIASHKVEGILSLKMVKRTIPPFGRTTVELGAPDIQVAEIDSKTWRGRQERQVIGKGWQPAERLRGLSGELLAELRLCLDGDVDIVATDYWGPVSVDESGVLRKK